MLTCRPILHGRFNAPPFFRGLLIYFRLPIKIENDATVNIGTIWLYL